MTHEPAPGYPPRPKTVIHKTADIDPTAEIGAECKIWRSVAILWNAQIGDRVSIGGCSEIGHHTTIGDGCRIGYNVFIPNNATIGRNVFIGPNVTFCDDKFPKVPQPWDEPYTALPPTVGDGASIGAGVVVLPGITIGRGARVAAGAIVTKDVPPYCAVRGGPARFFDAPEAWADTPDPKSVNAT